MHHIGVWYSYGIALTYSYLSALLAPPTISFYSAPNQASTYNKPRNKPTCLLPLIYAPHAQQPSVGPRHSQARRSLCCIAEPPLDNQPGRTPSLIPRPFPSGPDA